MKISIILPALVLSGASLQAQSDCCGGSAPANRVFREAATHESITERGKKAPDPIAALRVAVPPAETGTSEPAEKPSLIDRSEILHYGPLVTLVPKRAVLHLPDGLRGVRGMVKGKRLVNWREFYVANRAWIDTVEVTRAQAEGWEPLPEELTRSFEKRTKAVVAVLQGGPISVLPVTKSETPTAETASTEQP